jgi:hypothetical protein
VDRPADNDEILGSIPTGSKDAMGAVPVHLAEIGSVCQTEHWPFGRLMSENRKRTTSDAR